MPRYFFHTQTDTRSTDDEGFELLDDAAARREAVRASSEIVRDSPDVFWGTRPWTVTVTDVSGRVLYEVSVSGHATPVAG